MQKLIDVLRRVNWLAVIVVLLAVGAIIWVLVNPAAYPAPLVMVIAAVALASLGRESQ